jgi:hypothetical protein
VSTADVTGTPVPRVRSLTQAEFRTRFEDEQLPVVIEGAGLDSAAVRTWTPSALGARFADAPATFKVSSSNAHPDFRRAAIHEWFARRQGTFAEFLALISAGPELERSRYLFTGDEQFVWRRRDGQVFVDPHYAALLDDVSLPALVPEARLYTVWAWFSGPGVRTWLHYDNNHCHNLNAQIAGQKECWLFPPDELPKLAPFPLGGPNPAYNCSQIDVDQLDRARFPGFESAPRWHARLAPGDLLFIPAFWFHTFFHHGAFNANLNFWWRPETKVDNAVARRQAFLDLVLATELDAKKPPAASMLRALDDAAVYGKHRERL